MQILTCRFVCFVTLLIVVSSTARAQSPAGYALEYDGTDDQVNVFYVTDNYLFNAFPLTLSVWVKTTQVTAAGQGIVSDYHDGSLNGYSLFLLNGRARAWAG